MNNEQARVIDTSVDGQEDDGPSVSLADLLTWLGNAKKSILSFAAAAAVASAAAAFLLPVMYTARATLLAPGSQQQSGSAAALAALGPLGGLAGSLGGKPPDELYVSLLRSDSVQRTLATRFELQKRYDTDTYEALRKKLPEYIRVTSDKKSGLITVEVDDEDSKFAATLANAHAGEVTKVLGRLAVSEAQRRRVFFENQLKETKENLVKAEHDLQRVQEKSGVIVLDKQAEALISGAAQVRALIAEREVQLKVMRTSATQQNPEVIRLNSELGALRAELARMESSQGGPSGSAVSMPVGKLPEVAIDYVRARREVKLQEAILESMIRQYEVAKLDEAKEGPTLQSVDVALPPDRKSKPARGLILLGGTLAGLFFGCVVATTRSYNAMRRELNPAGSAAWNGVRSAWSWRH